MYDRFTTNARKAMARAFEEAKRSGHDSVRPITPRAKKVLELSAKEADQLGHSYLGTEHLLLGLLREHDGVAAQVLLDLGISLDAAREEVLDLLGAEFGQETGKGPPPLIATGPLVFLSREEASRLGHGFVGTGHLLLALLAEEDGAARRLLEGFGVGLERVRAEKEKLARYDLSSVGEEDLGASPLLRKVIRRATKLAQRLGGSSFDSRHLLLALVAEEDSDEARLLARLGVNPEEARRRSPDALGVAPGGAERLLRGEETPRGSGFLELLRRLFRTESR